MKSGGVAVSSDSGCVILSAMQHKSYYAALKSTSVLKSLTDNLKMRSRARRSKTNKYALMDDDDMESTLPIQEVIFHTNEKLFEESTNHGLGKRNNLPGSVGRGAVGSVPEGLVSEEGAVAGALLVANVGTAVAVVGGRTTTMSRAPPSSLSSRNRKYKNTPKSAKNTKSNPQQAHHK